MTTVTYKYGTGNPIGSEDVRDGIDNLKSFDTFMNDDGDSYNQRDGEVVRTVHGMNSNFDGMILGMNSDFDSIIDGMNSDFDGQILNMGFTSVGTFKIGATLTNPRQTLLWDIADGGDGQEYGWSGSFLPSGKVVPPNSTPASTGGISVGAWISRIDPSLRVQIMEEMVRSYAAYGHKMVDGSFESGGVLDGPTDVLLHELSGKAFSGSGPFPQTVAAGTSPSPSFFDRSEVIPTLALSVLGCTTMGDNTSLINSIFNSLSGSGVQILIDKKFPISGEVRIDRLLLSGTGSITGSGSIVGVVSNLEVPYENIQVWNNLVTASERNNASVVAADVVIDPLFGDDSSSTVVRSLQGAINLVASLVTASPTRDYTIALRSGRTELADNLVIPAALNGWGGTVDDIMSTSLKLFSEITINADSDKRYGLKIVNYAGEKSVICPETTWFFPSNANSMFRGHPVVANEFGVRFFKLFDADGSEMHCAASFNRKTGKLPRNQNRNVAISGTGPYTHKILLPKDVAEKVSSGAANINSARVRVTQWFTSSQHVENIQINGSELSFTGYTNTDALANGWAYISADQYGAPFYLENMKEFISADDEFVSTTSEVVLPTVSAAFFTTKQTPYASLVDFSNTRNVTLAGDIKVAFVQGDPVTLAMGTYGTRSNPLSAIKMGNYGAIDSITSYGIEGDAIRLSKVGALVKNTIIKRSCGNGLVHADGSHYSIVSGCDIDEYALDQFGAFGICSTGVEIDIFGNIVTRGGFSAIRADSSVFITDQSYGTIMSGRIYNNFCDEVGLRDGMLSERYPSGDAGVMTINGRGPATRYQVYSNVFGNCAGAGGSRAMFLDDGVNGVTIHHNVMFGAQEYSLDIRQVTDNTYNNHVFNNLLVGSVRQYSKNPDSTFKSNVVFGSLDIEGRVSQDSSGLNANTSYVRCQQRREGLAVNLKKEDFEKVITEFTKPFVRQLSYIGQ